MQYHYISDKELYHFGRSKKDGAKVGSGRYPLGSGEAANYSTKQRQYDRLTYGRGAEMRINKRLLNGESIQSARHREDVRKRRIKGIVLGSIGLGFSIYSASNLLRSKNMDNISVHRLSNSDRYVNIGSDAVREIFSGYLLHA